MKNYHSSVMISSAFWLCYACLIYRSLRLAHSISLFGRRNNALGSLAEYGWTHPILKFTQSALEEESALIIQSILPDLVREQFCTQGIILWSMGTILWSITCFFRFSRLFNSLKTQVFWELPLTKIKLLINQTEIFL